MAILPTKLSSGGIQHFKNQINQGFPHTSSPRYPSMTRVAELMGHTERVLQTCLSPDTSTLVSAGADETLRFEMAIVY